MTSIARVDVPVLMVAGRQSQFWPCEHAEAAVRDTAQGRAVVVEDSGHAVNFDQPEEFDKVLLGLPGGAVTATRTTCSRDIARHVPDERILRDPDVTAGLSHDEAEWAPVGTPLAVVRAVERRRRCGTSSGPAPPTASRSCRAAPAPGCPAARTPSTAASSSPSTG